MLKLEGISCCAVSCPQRHNASRLEPESRKQSRIQPVRVCSGFFPSKTDPILCSFANLYIPKTPRYDPNFLKPLAIRPPGIPNKTSRNQLFGKHPNPLSTPASGQKSPGIRCCCGCVQFQIGVIPVVVVVLMVQLGQAVVPVFVAVVASAGCRYGYSRCCSQVCQNGAGHTPLVDCNVGT